MPCYDDRSSYSHSYSPGEMRDLVEDVISSLSPAAGRRVKMKRELLRLQGELEHSNERRDLLARMLCSLMTKLSEGKPFQLGSIEGLEQWWTEHQMFDERRKARGEV